MRKTVSELHIVVYIQIKRRAKNIGRSLRRRKMFRLLSINSTERIKFYFNGHVLHLITRNNRKFPREESAFYSEESMKRYYFQLRAKVVRFWYVTTLDTALPRVGLSRRVIEPIWRCYRLFDRLIIGNIIRTARLWSKI